MMQTYTPALYKDDHFKQNLVIHILSEFQADCFTKKVIQEVTWPID